MSKKITKRRKSLISPYSAIHVFVILILLTLTILLFRSLYSRSGIETLPNNNQTNTNDTALAHTVLPPRQGAYLGVSFYNQNISDLDSLQQTLGKHFAIVGVYQSWGEKNNMFNINWARMIEEHDSVPMITWEPWKPVSGYDRSVNQVDEKDYRLSNITQGKFDRYIRSYARLIKQYKGPVFIRFAHEMNGDWYSWGSSFNTPKEYVDAWRHVHDIFSKIGAKNVTWVWAPNEIFTDSRIPYSDQIQVFYPGDAYVDWVGLSSFNWAGYYKQNIWRDPEQMFPETLKILAQYDKPIMIAETASADSNTGKTKAQWITDLATFVEHDPEVSAIVWFDTIDNGIDWRIESNRTNITSFKTGFGTYFVGKIMQR